MKIARIFFAMPAATATALVLALATGCRTVDVSSRGTGDMRAVYQYGEFGMLLNGTAPAAAAAAEAAIKELDLYAVSKKLDTYDAELAARTRKDQKVTIAINEVNSRQTMIRIRVGTTGDLAISRQIYDAVERHMTTGETPAR